MQTEPALPHPPPPPHRTTPPPAPEAAADVTLLDRLASGDPGALSSLYERFSPQLMALARRLVGAHEEAEEILQETFLQAWRKARTYDPRRAAVSTWLVLILRSRAIDRLRSRESAQRTRLRFEQQAGPPVAWPTAGAALEAAEQRRSVRRALGELPPEQRAAIEMSYFRGLSHRQIAADRGIPEGTVKTRIWLGMKKLRAALAGELGALG